MDQMILKANEAEHLAQANTMEDICNHVLGGGSILDLAEMWKIPAGRILLWMKQRDEDHRQYIQALNVRAEIDAELIKRQLKRIHLADFAKAYDKDNKLKPIAEWPEDLRLSVTGLKFEDGKLVNFIQESRTRALELHGKTIALFTEKVDMSGTMTLEQMLVEAQRSAETELQNKNAPGHIPGARP